MAFAFRKMVFKAGNLVLMGKQNGNNRSFLVTHILITAKILFIFTHVINS